VVLITNSSLVGYINVLFENHWFILFKGLQTIFAMFFVACIYGDIMKIDTTGASEATAKQDKLTVKGMTV